MGHSLSFWESETEWYDRDYVIVGAGITGLTAAIQIAKRNTQSKILIVDKLPIGSGASSRNAGFSCIGSISELNSDLQEYGVDRTLDTLRMRYDGLKYLIDEYGLEKIGYKANFGCELFRTEQEYIEASEMIDYWNRLLEPITQLKSTFISEPTSRDLKFYGSCILNRAEGLLNTGLLINTLKSKAQSLGIKFINGLELVSYESEIDHVSLIFKEILNPLKSRNLILCTNAFISQLVPELNVIPCRNQVIVTSPLELTHLPYGYHLDKGFVYFRMISNRLLIGGARNIFESENNVFEFGRNTDNVEYLLRLLSDFIVKDENISIDFSWSGILCGGKNRTPIVKFIDPNVVVSVRLGGMGVAIGSIIGQRAANMVLSKTF